MILRKTVSERTDEQQKTAALGRFNDKHVYLTSTEEDQFDQYKTQLLPLLHPSTTGGNGTGGISTFVIIDAWHVNALIDIFASELIYNMRNNVADYVSDDLLPERYNVPILTPIPGRTLLEIQQLIARFSNSSNLLKHLFAEDLLHHSTALRTRPVVFHGDGSVVVEYTALDIARRMAARGDNDMLNEPLTDIIDLAFPDLFYCLRQMALINSTSTSSTPAIRFSVSATADHRIALASPITPDVDVLSKIQHTAHRFTVNGEVIPSWREYAALSFTFAASLTALALGVWQNWASRQYVLERIFDGVGLFGLVAGILLAIISRRLDFYDLAGIVQRRKRFLESYAELLTVLDLSDNDVKAALTFEGVKLPPVARDCTSFAFHRHAGVFDPFSGLDTTTTGLNIIVGNKTAMSRGKEEMRYYKLKDGGGVFHLVPAPDAAFRIVTDGDDKTIK